MTGLFTISTTIFLILVYLQLIYCVDIISTIAGSSTSNGFSGDNGAATSAAMKQPRGVAVDSSGMKNNSTTIILYNHNNYLFSR